MLPLRLDDVLDQQIYNEGVYLEEHVYMPGVQDGMYYSADDMPYPIIAINPCVSGTYQRNYIKAHELGHHHNCVRNLFDAPSWVRQKYELLADRDWIDNIMAIDDLIIAYEKGNDTPMSLAEYLEIPIDALMKGLSIRYQQYGEVSHKGQYCIYWNPFNIKKGLRRKQ
ncbi:MAG: hypothetical protein VB081_09970 [Christensenella sp.]|uniref:ImmA/IrrE family metallo-endopeptidase n=1 Tax=Christensenella sp. TaxID=1935934 RepID=UPI002B1EFD81|nr:hypothetical protein [Christensenella sp.]MEA5003812.1 hypothetical protein [Christensenella sp.]